MTKKTIPLQNLGDPGLEIIVKDISRSDNADMHTTYSHNAYQLFLFEEGGGNQLIDFHPHNIQSNYIYLIRPGHLHLMERSPQANGICMQFSADYLTLLYLTPSKFDGIFSTALSEEEFKTYYHLIQQVKEQYDQASPSYEFIARHCLFIILLKLGIKAEQHTSKSSLSNDQIYQQFRNSIEQNFHKIHTIKSYEQMLDISAKKLNAITKKKTGKTALQLLQQRMILEIKKMLYNGVAQEEILSELNFDSKGAFNQFVEKLTDYSPVQLKENLKNVLHNTNIVIN